MPKRLGGTCGVPGYDDRVYVRVASITEPDGHMRPTEITWVDERRFPVMACQLKRVLGRWDYGTIIMVWEVELVHRARRNLFWERGQWFVARRCVDRNGEYARGEPLN